MPCCKICCGCSDCAQGQSGKCCCGGAQGSCCATDQVCCSGVCCNNVCCNGVCCPPGQVCQSGVCVDPPTIGACCRIGMPCVNTTETNCYNMGGFFFGGGTVCAAFGVPSSGISCTNAELCNACCPEQPATVNVSLNASVSNMPLLALFESLSFDQNRYYIEPNANLAANITLTKPGSCGSYVFNGGCGLYFGGFRNLTATLALSYLFDFGGRCRWTFSFSAIYDPYCIFNDVFTRVNTCGQRTLTGSISASAMVETSRATCIIPPISATATQSQICQSLLTGRPFQCVSMNPNTCAIIAVGGSYSVQQVIQWSAAF